MYIYRVFFILGGLRLKFEWSSESVPHPRPLIAVYSNSVQWWHFGSCLSVCRVIHNCSFFSMATEKLKNNGWRSFALYDMYDRLTFRHPCRGSRGLIAISTPCKALSTRNCESFVETKENDSACIYMASLHARWAKRSLPVIAKDVMLFRLAFGFKACHSAAKQNCHVEKGVSV